MKAAVCYEYGKPLVVEDIEIDAPKAGEVKVRMRATAICHSDIHLVSGDWGFEPPVVAGHEGAGVVEQLGPGVASVREGDHVVVSLLRSCGRCDRCLAGVPHLCDGDFDLQHTSRLRNHQGQPIRQGIFTAAFAEAVVVDQSQLAVVPAGMPSASAALLACGVITGVGAVHNTARVQPGSSVGIIGIGGVGLNAVQGSFLAGANPIVAIDIVDGKLEAALTFGATHVLHAQSPELPDAVSRITGGRMLDYVFVTVGRAAAAEQAFALTGKRGMVVLVGLPGAEARISVPIWPTVMGEKRIIGSLMGSTRLREDVRKLVALYQGRRLKLDELISERFPLERINEAISGMSSGTARRNVVVFG